MSNIEEYTKNFKFMIPEFNVATWHTEIKENFKAIDALIANFVQSQQYKGAWKQVTQYGVGDLVYISDENSNNYGGLFKVLVEHITTADDFDTFLRNNPTFYNLQGEMGAQIAALRAQDWAEKTDGIVTVNESPVDYSSKAYAIGGIGTETNNSKYFKEQAELARDTILQDPGFIVVKDDLLGDENIKTVAENIQNINNVSDNILSILTVHDNLSAINVCSSNINAILDAPNQATIAQNSANSAEQSAQTAIQAALSITNGYDLLDHKWSDHLLNDQNWLRADTFSWHPATTQYGTYLEVYNHLVNDISGKTLQSETIGEITVQFYLADDGHKICPAGEESNVSAIYTATGVAWYYILDTENQRFKLPRELPITDKSKGNSITLGLTDGTHLGGIYYDSNYPRLSPGNDIYGSDVGTLKSGSGSDFSSSKSVGITTDPTKSGIISHRANENGQQYLYFYVGQFSQTATEQTAGLNSELFNGKMDRDMSNMNPSQTTKETIVGWGMPDFTSAIDITSAASYICPSAGYLRLYAVYNGHIYYKSNLDTQLSDWTYNAVGASSRAAGNWYIVQKNEVLSKTDVSGSSKAFFYPLKGVNNA